jgi:hypothetical protein
MFEIGYSAVEPALVRTYRVRDKNLGAFRGRLTALQKQGLLGAAPGKGIALRYKATPDLLHRLVFACEMLQFGISPAVVLGIVEAQWERRLRKIFRDAEDAVPQRDPGPGPDDVVLHFAARVMTDTWSDAVPAVNSCRLRNLPSNLEMWMAMKADDPMGLPPRVVLTNLTMVLRAFHTALADSYMDELRAEAQAVPRASRMRKRKGK